ncbi:peptidyl-prolyl cis-trans isomerase A (rotamase A) [Burkholderiales bacterium]|nr:peptidyl-prolyl cis-trans isomerase A (rotamase A) [Burkholderiales bacterium]
MHEIRRLTCLAVLAVSALGFSEAPCAQTPAAAPVIVTLETTAGTIVLELDAQHAPRSVANFVQYVKDGYYPGTIFHRVMAGFMIQGGGFTEDHQQKPTRVPIAIESNNGLKNVRGSLAMARTSNPDSATAQFFINVADNPFLDYPGRDGNGYTVFGHVVEGMDTVDKIGAAATANKGGAFANLPVTPIVITKARLGK